MGAWFLTAWGEFDVELCEEISKHHKVDVKVVEKHYLEMLNNIVKELNEKVED